jgi:hypothetical protein
MRDFYSALDLPVDASEDVIRRALDNAPADLRVDAEFILLDRRRRVAYDRNHQLLTTIGQLLSHLGLCYTRFWARQEYKEFWNEVVPEAKPRGRRVDAVLIAGAFRAVGAVGRHGRKHVTRGSNWLIALIVLSAFVVAYLIVWLAR